MSRKNRIELFKAFRRQGIIEYNREQAAKAVPQYQGERKRRKYFALERCSSCNATISKRFFSRHKQLCKKRNDIAEVIGIPVTKYDVQDTTLKLSDNFKSKILGKLWDDDVGKMVRKDPTILYVGQKLYRKLCHKKEKVSTLRTQVRTEMRMLATIYIEFKSMDYDKEERFYNSMDLFCRENFDTLCDCIDNLTRKEDKSLKSGQRKNMYYMLVRSGKRLRDKLFQEKKDDLSSELNSFIRLLKSNEDTLLSNALYNLEKAKLKKSRKPSQLPLEEDIKIIYDYIQKKLKELCSEFTYWTSSTFVEVRNLAMTRLTLLNARRGGEAGRLQIEDWEEAEKDGWIDKQRLNKLSEADQMLVRSLKIAFQAGKGNSHLVSLLIPNDSAPALRKLSDKDARAASGVLKDNTFVFASTQQSELNFSGWHALKEVCKNLKLKKPNLINATNNRHRVSTLYAALEIPEHERDLFFKHMGHSKIMNETRYQCPLAVQGITKVGRELLRIEGG